jgi:hypothetical protein
MQAIKDYESNKWKVIGQKLGKPAKVRVIPFTYSLRVTASLAWCVVLFQTYHELLLARLLACSLVNGGAS